MELHSSAGPLDMDLGADQGSTQTVDFPSDGSHRRPARRARLRVHRGRRAGLALAPTVETPRIKGRRAPRTKPTQEVAIEDLGLDVGD